MSRTLHVSALTLVFALFLSLAIPASAADINVGCSTGELIAAINTANGNAEADTLTLAAACVYTFTEGDATNDDSALPRITSEIVISGSDATLQRDSQFNYFRMFYVDTGGKLTLTNVSISDTYVTGDGGAIYSEGILNLTDVTISGARSAGYGGGVYTIGTATLSGVTITGGSAYSASGGGLYNSGSLTLTDSTITQNTFAFYGGGIYNTSSTADMTIVNSTISGNTSGGASGGGGGIFNYSQSTMHIIDSTVSGNTVDHAVSAVDGGGILNQWATLTVVNSTISGNTADGEGGGIHNTSSGIVTVMSSTLSGNSSDRGGGIFNNNGTLTVVNSVISGNDATSAGGGLFNGHWMDVINTTIAGNTQSGVSGIGSTNIRNSVLWGNELGPIYSAGISNSIVEGGFAGGTNILDADPLFVAPDLFANAPTTAGDYHVLPLSPARDIGNNASLPADVFDLDNDLDTTEPIPYDRDDGPRVIGPAVDLGAYELSVLELLINGDFEAGSAPWEVVSLGKDKVKDKEPYDGTFAFRFKGFAGKTPAKAKQKVTNPPVEDGQSLVLTAQINSGASADGKMMLKVKTSLGNKVKPQIAFDQTGGYTLHQASTPITLAVGETVTKAIVIFNDKSQSGKVYVDAVSLVVQSAAPRTETRSDILPPPAAPGGFRGGN
ncbi:MAG: hypothetical protein IPM16_16815 [Chloroflexi bacterium]|nr:hypothetical protein [Chloroflexota bacterium]